MTDNKPSTAKQTKGDDRNLVDVDSSDAGLSLEDWLFLTWKNHRSLIIGGIVGVLAVILGREAWVGYVEARQERISAAFGVAETIEAKRAFARDNIGHPLAGVALLEVADEVYSNRDYRMAEVEYRAAVAALTAPLFLSRARLGEAVSAIQNGSVSAGEPLLRSIVDDPQVPEPIKAEALYQLASVQFAEDHFEESRATLDELANSSGGAAWVSAIAALRAQLPAESSSVSAPAE